MVHAQARISALHLEVENLDAVWLRQRESPEELFELSVLEQDQRHLLAKAEMFLNLMDFAIFILGPERGATGSRDG